MQTPPPGKHPYPPTQNRISAPETHTTALVKHSHKAGTHTYTHTRTHPHTEEQSVPIEVYGPETHMTAIVSMVLGLQSSDPEAAFRDEGMGRSL